MKTLDLWNKFRVVPQSAQKAIKGGRLSGMTDISPMWRYMVLTEQFGPCGIGWKYTVDKQWTEQGDGGEVCAFANVSLYIKVDGEWSAAIHGNGGSMLVAKEKSGLHTSDEAYKMAITDALSVCCKMLGIAADIYWFAGSKYGTDAAGDAKASDHKQPPTAPAKPEDPAKAEYRRIEGIIKAATGIDGLSGVPEAIDAAEMPQKGKYALTAMYSERYAELVERAFT